MDLRLTPLLPNALSLKALGRFGQYLDLLLLWNRKINLTSVRDAEGIVIRHFADSLAVLPHVPIGGKSLVDVGSGPGFPGMVIALMRDELKVTLVEANHKKAAFLSTVRRELGLLNVEVRSERVEEILRDPDFSPFDVAVSRATWDLLEWLEIGRTLVRSGGMVIGMEATEEHILPTGCVRVSYEIPNLKRALVLCST